MIPNPNITFLHLFFYNFTYVFVYMHILCLFWYVFLDFVHIKLIVNKQGRRRRPPPISLSILYEENPKIYTKYRKNMQIHKNICKHVEKYMKKCYVGVGNQTLAQMFLHSWQTPPGVPAGPSGVLGGPVRYLFICYFIYLFFVFFFNF